MLPKSSRNLRNGRRPRGRKPVRPSWVLPAVDELADRIVPAFVSVFNAISGDLTITGNGSNDTGSLTTNGSGDILLNGALTGANVSNTNTIHVIGNGGNDYVDLSGVVGFTGSTTLDGGDGNDTLIGSDRPDKLV